MSSDGEALVPQMIAVDQIRPSGQQVRTRFDAEPLGELAESIRMHGILQPVLVRKHAEGYELIAGERRWRAARLAGLTSVPAVGCAAIQSSVSSGVISAGHARALVALESQAAQENGLKVVIAKHLSVRQTENWVRTYRPKQVRRRDSSTDLHAIAADIESSLGLPIKVAGSLNRGKLEIRYSSREELERVCAKLVS
jgi:ParB family chromosome partitioning protein